MISIIIPVLNEVKTIEELLFHLVDCADLKNINEIIKFLEFFNKQNNPNYFIWYGQKKNYNINRIRTSKTLENIV